jgi:hypothetical protein
MDPDAGFIVIIQPSIPAPLKSTTAPDCMGQIGRPNNPGSPPPQLLQDFQGLESDVELLAKLLALVVYPTGAPIEKSIGAN